MSISKPKLAVVIGSIRPNRFADHPAQWIAEIARQRGDFDVEVIDLKDYPMPLFGEEASPAYAPSKSEVARRWQQKVAGFDAYVFTAAEYNHGPAPVLKNALDYAYNEWSNKPVAFVGYGGVGGARAVEQLRLNAIELQMARFARPSTSFSRTIWRWSKKANSSPSCRTSIRPQRPCWTSSPGGPARSKRRGRTRCGRPRSAWLEQPRGAGAGVYSKLVTIRSSPTSKAPALFQRCRGFSLLRTAPVMATVSDKSRSLVVVRASGRSIPPASPSPAAIPVTSGVR